MSSGRPTSIQNAPRITIELGGDRLEGWTGLQVIRQIDAAADQFVFSLPWDPTPENRLRFAPYNQTGNGIARIYIDNTLMLRGYIEKSTFTTSAAERTLTAEGRSEPGIFVDWCVGPRYQFEGTFNTIAREASRPSAGVAPTVRAKPDTAVFTAEAEIGQTVYDFLSSMASGNGLWAVPFTTAIGSGLEFIRLDPNQAPVARLIEGESPFVEIVTTHDITRRHRRFTVVQEAGGANASATVEDRAMAPAIRGTKVTQLQQESRDLDAAARWQRSRALIDSYTCDATVTGWTHNGELWAPGTIVEVTAPGAAIYTPTPLMISRVTFQLDESGGQQAQLSLSLPEAYSGGYPRRLPWVG